MPGSLIPSANQRFYDASGKPLVGGKITTYSAGTTSKKTTFQDRVLSVANTNPVTLDARGEATMYGTGVYRLMVKAANGALIYDRDNIEVFGGVLDAIVVDIADVEAARAAAIVGIDSDVAALDAYRVAGQVLIDADVSAVDSAKNTAINTTIPASIATVDASKVSAQSSIAVKVAAVDSTIPMALNTMRAAYYGALEVAPTLRPDGSARQIGDRYYNITTGAENTWNGSVWYVPNIDSAALAASGGAGMVGSIIGSGGAASTVQQLLGIVMRGYVFRGAWVTATNFAVRDIVSSGGIFYECTLAHMSGAALTTIGGSPWMRFTGNRAGTNTDGGYAIFSVHENFTTIDRHAFEDYSHLPATDTGKGYASYDAKPQLENSLAQDHLIGFQSRPRYAGSATLARMYGHDALVDIDAAGSGNVTNGIGFYAKSRHLGTGTIGELMGVRIDDDTGTGAISNNTGIWLANRTRGAANYGIYQQAGAACINVFGAGTHKFAGSIFLTDTNGGVVYGADSSGKSISYGFGAGGQANFGTHRFYNGKSSEVLTISDIRTSFGNAAKLKSYTYATLPSGLDGDIVYCSNGRKAAEAAGAGTGCPVYYSTTGFWCSFRTDATVTA